jgi:hypothetical protein
MSFTRFAVIAGLLWCVATPAAAQPVTLRFHDGLVTLSVQNAPVRTILAEWARLGGTTVVNAERVTGPPVTLELNAVPEAQALAILLRSAAGYMAATRAAGTPGASVYDRILILPTSVGPRNPAPVPGFGNRPPVVRQPQVQQPPPEPDEPLIEPDEPPDDVEPVNPLLRRGTPPGRPPLFPQPTPNVPPEDDADVPDNGAQPPQPGNPFGIPAGATSRPGIVTPVPRADQPQRTQPDPEP